MSRITSEVIKFTCDGHGYMQAEKCTGHTMQVQACLSSDTVSIIWDNDVDLVLSDEGFHALEDAIKSLNEKWQVHTEEPVTDVPTIKVKFLSKRIRTDGELGSVVIGAGDAEIEITPEQAKSLAKTITAKYGESEVK